MQSWIASRLRASESAAESVFAEIGAVAQLSLATVRGLLKKFPLAETVRQMEVIGIQSLGIAVLTAIFSSLVMTVQFGVQLARFGSLEYVGNVVALSLVRELGPVLTALLVGGRVGAGIAAQLGSMAVTDQIDAIRSMGADPIRKLVVPRVLAAVVMLPLLTVLADVLGACAAMLIAWIEYDINPTYFRHAVVRTVRLSDFLGGLAKTPVFGFLLAVIACHRGLSTTGGTEGVGRATTQTVVITSIVTLIADFILTWLLISMGY